MPTRRRSIVCIARTTLPATAIVLAVTAAMLAGPPAEPGAATKADAAKPAAAKKADTKADKKPEEQTEPADNSYCYVCHANYQKEKLTHVHQPQGVGCERCHGESSKHSGDEDGLAPPDRMFAKSDIDAFCITCHSEDQLRKRDLHREWLADSQRDETCNECHGKEHRIKVRTRQWDKRTGKLIRDDGVRMMQKDSPASGGQAEKAETP